MTVAPNKDILEVSISRWGGYAGNGLKIFIALLCATGLSAQGVLTWHNDAARTGQNLLETLLSPANVKSANFGLLFKLTLDGQVDAQPLYVPAVSISGGTHNVLYVATENDTLYAFDADAGGSPLWSVSLASGESPSDSDNGCGQVGSEVGITSTPAINLASGPHGTIYVVAMSKDGSGNYHHRLHALDITTGVEEAGWPILVQASYPSNGPNSSGGVVTLNPIQYKERAGLLISNGVIYTTWASNCDISPYNGWLIGYNESTQAQTVLNLTPNADEGAIWQAGAGPAADAGGNLYFLMANGTFDTTLNANGFPSGGDYGNAFMNISTKTGLAVADYFTMDNTVSESNVDEDLGSGGEMLLPVLNDAMGNPHELAVGAGKDGNAYVVDRNDMGKFKMNSNAVYQLLPLGGGVFSSPAWFNNTMYYAAVGQQLAAYPYSDGSFGSASSQSAVSFGFPGATPSISANGTTNGIVWAVNAGSPAVLYAYDATNLASELYDSAQAGSRDTFGDGIHFPTPTVANGKVYVGTTTGVGAFGLRNCTYSAGGSASVDATAHAGAASVTAGSGCSWSATTTSNFITITGGSPGSGGGSVSYSVPANPGTQRVGTIIVAGFPYTITQAGSDSLAAPSGPAPANGSVGTVVSPTLSWTASTGATSYDVYFGTMTPPPLVTSTASTSYAPGTLIPGVTYYWMVVANNSSGSDSSPIWSFTTTNATTVSVTPNSGSGTTQTFALKYSDTAGAASLLQAWVYFNATLANPATNACMLYYNIAANQINLLNDTGTAWTPATLGTSTTLQNSQCSLNAQTATATQSGGTLTLNLTITFKPIFGGTKNIYLHAVDISGTNSGWQQLGAWTLATAGTPSTVSVMPSSGSGNSQTFTLQYSDTAGAANLQQVWAYFNATLANPASHACMLFYNPATNQINLLNDGTTLWMPATLGSATTLQNSQCSLNAATATAVPSGNTLTLTVTLAFKPAFDGAKNVYLHAVDLSGANGGWQQLGTWTVAFTAGTASTVSVTPSSGSGTSRTFALQYSDTQGAANLQQAWVYFNATLANPASHACMLYYNAATSQINLLNDNATAWLPATVGAATTLENSQCSLNVAATTVTLSGNALTLNVALTFQAGFTGAKNVYLHAVDEAGSNSGWQQLGTWTP
jgi:hypothetical protein